MKISREDFILDLTENLSQFGVEFPFYEALRYVLENPGMETEMTPYEASREWVDAAADI